MQKAVVFGPTWMILDRHFQTCGFYLSAACAQLQFGESAASDQVQLLYMTLRYVNVQRSERIH